MNKNISAYVMDAREGKLIMRNYALYVKGTFIAQGSDEEMTKEFGKLSKKGDYPMIILVEKELIEKIEDRINRRGYPDESI